MQTYREHMRKQARGYLRGLLKATHHNVTYAARKAHLNRTHFYKLMRRLDIHRHRKHFGNWEQFGL